MGFRTTLWVHPFVNLDSSSLDSGLLRLAYVTDPGGRLPALTNWWAGSMAVIYDFTAPRGADWFQTQLRALQLNFNVDSFKFDAGEASYLPNCYKLSQTARNPSIYSKRFAETCLTIDSSVRHQEIRVGAQTQYLPLFVRMLDKDSNWSYFNGIQTIIPHALNFGLIGYPFILPDMIGGNGYNQIPDKELFIRWVELNVFLPSVQFSIAPWNYDEEVVQISKKMCDLHEQYAQLMIDLGREATRTGAPIVRPLWWIAPRDPVAQEIDSEFLVGDDLLVAPVLTQGARSRDIYLPDGEWHDELRDVMVSGGRWLTDYAVALDELAYFTRITS
jgi:alpha-glucosidase (family GH31 glycosyl hydrolase)